MDEIKNQVNRNNKRTIRAIIGSSLLVTAALLVNVELPFLNGLYSYLPEAITAALGTVLLIGLLLDLTHL